MTVHSYRVWIRVRDGWELWLAGRWVSRSAVERDVMSMGLPAGASSFYVSR